MILAVSSKKDIRKLDLPEIQELFLGIGEKKFGLNRSTNGFGRRDKVYGALGATGGNALGTVLLNGLVIASWKSRFKGGKMEISLLQFEKPSGALRKRVEAAFEEIAQLVGTKSVLWDTQLVK